MSAQTHCLIAHSQTTTRYSRAVIPEWGYRESIVTLTLTCRSPNPNPAWIPAKGLRE